MWTTCILKWIYPQLPTPPSPLSEGSPQPNQTRLVIKLGVINITSLKEPSGCQGLKGPCVESDVLEELLIQQPVKPKLAVFCLSPTPSFSPFHAFLPLLFLPRFIVKPTTLTDRCLGLFTALDLYVWGSGRLLKRAEAPRGILCSYVKH